jgi:stress-induced morphogen
MSPLQQDVTDALKQVFSDETDLIEFTDPNLDGRHFHLKIVSKQFEGKSRIQQHRMVYTVIEKFIETGSVHAVEMKLSSNR